MLLQIEYSTALSGDTSRGLGMRLAEDESDSEEEKGSEITLVTIKSCNIFFSSISSQKITHCMSHKIKCFATPFFPALQRNSYY